MTVSVLIPARNRAGVLPRAIASVMAQTLPADEVIVVDDGSTDNTADVVENIARTHPTVKLIRNPVGLGAPIARNTGAREAHGDFLALLDSDDVWRPDKLERQLALLSRNPTAPAAFSGFAFHYATRPHRIGRAPPVVEPSDLFIRNVLGGSSSAVVRRAAWTATGGFDPEMPSCQDWDFWLRLAALGPLVADPEPLVEYHFDGDGRISGNRERVEDGHRRMFSRIEKNVPEGCRRVIRAYHQIRMAEIYAEQCYSPVQNLRRAGAAAWSGRTVDTTLLATKAVAKMMLASLDRVKARL
jgi:glycosyltransferase involved in cell wall biosynthesis